MAFVHNNSSIRYEHLASEALSGLSPFQLVFLRDPPDLTSLSFPKIDTIPVKHREYYNLLLARAQLVGNMLLEWRTKQALEYESKAKKFRNEEIFQDNQMVYLLPMSLFSIETAPVPLDAETYIGEKREYTQIIPETELIALTENNYIPLTQAQILLCAKIGYMYYCEYAHLLKKRMEHTCMSAYIMTKVVILK